MNAKEYLSQLSRLDAIINQRIKEKSSIRRYLADLSAAAISQEKVQGGSLPEETGFTEKVIKMIDLETEIDRMIDEYVDLKHKIIGKIHGLGNASHIKLLYARYVDGKRFEEIAVEMNYAYAYIKQLHKKALQEFETSYPILP